MNSSPTTEAPESARVRVVYEGETVEAEEIPFTTVAETKAKFELSDGAIITIDHAVKAIYRLCEKKKEDGNPIYLITGQVTVNADLSQKKAD